ncbi:MAG: hypothetical protein MSC30_08275 [Gaiellaceae bacterium MAG52_C11]|nr:hypothetical protein [Candidatus Gaiellasilicea maunaloa]
MDRRERERILRQGVVLPETPRRQRELAALVEDLVEHPLQSRPLRQRYRNFTPDAGSYFAALGGPLPYMARLREIEALVAGHELALADRYATADTAAWREVAESWSFGEVNDLIDRHNRWYPIEARLPMDPHTGDFVLVNGEPYWKRPLDARWVLERFPAA